MERIFLILCGVYGFLGVALGAFGAHGLEGLFREAADGGDRASWWATATQYHLVHALALGLAAWTFARAPGGAALASGWCFAAGVLLFSGSLYAMALTGLRGLAVITPFGGLLMLAGWVALTIAAWRSSG
jgi:uncharacterized membrane protein YgdD (TMEM256/DUF423 family)